MFVLASDITIGSFHFKGVNKVQIKRSIHSIVDTAVIRLPSIAKIVADGKVSPDTVITGKQFSDGDPVVIKLGYGSDLQTEFAGFVKRCNVNMPLEIECEGYSWLLRRNIVNVFSETLSIKDLLTKAISNIDGIKIDCKLDVQLVNVHLANVTGFEIINNIAKYSDTAISCFFIKPDTLWCGFVYTPFADGSGGLNTGTINYRLGYNTIKDNTLKERISENDPVQVEYSKKLSDGSKINGLSDVFNQSLRMHSRVLNQLKDAPALKQLANEKAYMLNYSGYEGAVTTFLQPYAGPGFQAYVTDARYPKRNGIYLVESVETTFGQQGARRIIEIGPRLGSAN